MVPTEQHSPLPVLKHRDDFGNLLESLKMRIGAEVGVQQGVFAEKVLRNWPSCMKYYLIDPWVKQENYSDRANVSNEVHEKFLQDTQERLAPFQHQIQFLRMFSVDAAIQIPDSSLDFVYIDGRHDYESVMQDLETFLPKVRRGGIVAGHDYVDNDFVLTQGDDWAVGPKGRRHDYKAVKSAVDRFVQRWQKQLIVCYAEGDYPSWYFRR